MCRILISTKIIIASLLLVNVAIAADKNYDTVELKEFTSIDLHLVPDLGTRLIFPFIIDDPTHKPPFAMKMTNGSLFETSFDQQQEALGQNSMVINARAPKSGGVPMGMLSDLFLSVDGYNISIRLHMTGNMDKHRQNIVFTLSDEQRLTLIERQVEARVQQALGELARKEQQLDRRTESIAISNMGVIAMHKPRITHLKERLKNTVVTGERIDIVAQAFRNYKDQYYMLEFDIDNKSTKSLSVDSLDVYSVSKQAQEPIAVSFHCDENHIIDADSVKRCLAITSDPLLLRAAKLELQVSTSLGALSGTL